MTFAAVSSLLMLIPRIAAPLLAALPPVARTLVVTGTMVALLTYGLMPALTRLLHGWLYPDAAAHVCPAAPVRTG